MARKSSPTILQEELYPPDEQVRPDFEDARMLDLDAEEESPFLRGQKRVSVRRGPLPKKAALGLKWFLAAFVILCLGLFAGGSIYRYGKHSWRFRIASSDDIEITGNNNVTHAQVMEVMGGDIGRNIFFVPLAQRRMQLEQIPWVESASVMRFVPHRLKIEIHERTPVAFARVGSHISLIDAGGALMDLTPNKKKYSFPVVLGMNPGEPLSMRAARMRIYNQLIRELDSGGARYSADLSEVDLSDADDVEVVANDSRGAVLIHLGSGNYLERYRVYVTHVQQWRQQFDKLEAVDLRYDRQIVVNPDLRAPVKQIPLGVSAAKLAVAVGVKPAALVKHDVTPPRKQSSIPPAKAVSKPVKKPARALKPKHGASKGRAKPVTAKPPRAVAKKAVSGAKPEAQKVPAQLKAVSIPKANSKASNKPSPAISKEKEKGTP
jgi:cell division protein FtsQ